MSNMPDRALLESKARDELMQIAAALGVEVPARARKDTIISAILAPDGTDSAAGDRNEAAGESASSPQRATTTRRTRTAERDADEVANDKARQPPTANGVDVSDTDDPELSQQESNQREQDTDDAQVAEEGNRRNRRRGRGRDDTPIVGETVHCDGLLDLRDEGYGFLRTAGPLPSADDVYVAARQVRQYDLRRGDRITGVSRPAARSERNPALLRLDTLNGEPPPEEPNRSHFDRLTPVLPTDALRLSSGPALSGIDAAALIGLGSRGLLTARGTRSLSPLMVALATAIGDLHPDAHLMVLLVSERPEDVTELTRRLETSGEVVASTFNRPPEEHLAVAELTLERTKRMAEAGGDVIVLFNGLTQLARAYAASGSGRHQPADAAAAAISSTLRFFGGGCNLEEAGSITMLATARTATGSPADDQVTARLREAANLELALDENTPALGQLEPKSGEFRFETASSYSQGNHHP